jgi:periplasmic divalent cation tolerance protein
MDTMIVVYIPCTSVEEAKTIGLSVMNARLAPCYNILTDMQSAAFWPPKIGEIETVSSGSVLLIKSVASKFTAIEQAVKKLHSDSNPCIFALNVSHVSKEYYDWLISEMEAV